MNNWNGIISLLFASIEFILIINLLVMAEKTKVNKLAITLVVLLCIYQLLEFLMCYCGLSKSFMAYLAFCDISFLPPIGLFMVINSLGYSNSKKIKLIFLPAVFFIIYYGFTLDKFKVVSCTVLYASYNYPLGDIFGFFYYLPIVITMILLFLQIKKEVKSRKTFLSKVLLTGYIVVSIPVILSFIFAALKIYFLQSVIESIMCKFALALALCYTFFSLYDRKKVTLQK